MLRRATLVIGGVAAVWLAALALLDVALAGRQARAVTARLGASLQATATIADTDLALIRGRVRLAGLAIRRDDRMGHLAIDVRELRCELAPLGWALIDRECGELAVRGTRLEVSTAALFQLPRPRQAPVRADRVVIDDATLAFSPSAFLPGLGRIEIRIEHAESGPTVLRTPLSWLLTMTTLRARLDLPAGLVLRLSYAGGVLSASGSLFGATPVALPMALPVAQTARDGQEEIAQLVQLAKELAERLVAKRAEDWLRAKLGGP